MEKDCNPLIPESYIMYFHINNQYGASMSESLPYTDFEWLENYTNDFFLNIPDDSPEGDILEVDLEYPIELHNSNKDLPFCSEHFIPPLPKCTIPKLIINLLPKKNYTIHFRNLKLYLSLGMKLTKIHRVLNFRQKQWLKPYIDLNTELRKKSNNEFEQNFYKLMYNSVLVRQWKMLENTKMLD